VAVATWQRFLGARIWPAGDGMVRKDVSVNERQLASADAAETAPARDLDQVLLDVRNDAAAAAPKYLTETEVPYGGE
jgi:hypothetical protein